MCGLAFYLLTALWIILLYKLLDYLIRIPMRSSPTSVVDNILITGCDTGFGHMFALRLDLKGFRVFAGCLTEKGKSDLEKASGSGRLKAFIMDVTSTDSVDHALKFVKSHLSSGEGLWGVVNNAGTMQKNLGPLEWLTKQDFQHCCDVNLFGMADVTRIFLPLVKTTRGRFVNVSSVGGRIGLPCSAAYTASKYGVEGFSDSVRTEVRVFGVSVHIIEPGCHSTALMHIPSLQRYAWDAWRRLPAELKLEYPEEYAIKTEVGLHKYIGYMTSHNLDEVVDCYEHALLSYFPRGRYMPGKDARYAFWFLSYTPEWFTTWLFNQVPDGRMPTSARPT